MSVVSKEDPEYPGVQARGHFKRRAMYGEGDIRVVQKKASGEERGNQIGYTLRKPENNITCSALQWNPQGFRSKVVRSKQVDSLYIKVNK